MIIFSVGIRIWDKSIFTHNVLHEVHVGDFVLPMFIFASGLSVYHFKQKYKNDFLRLIERSAVIFYVWVLLSVFIAGFLKMDELILGGILFIPGYLLCNLRKEILLGMCVILLFSYPILNSIINPTEYLGGFGSAYFYFSITLIGILISRKESYILTFALILTIICMIFFPIDKTTASPSFMGAGIIFCILAYHLLIYLEKILKLDLYVDSFPIKQLIFISKHPVACWIIMVVLMIIPIEIIKIKNKI